MKTIHDIRCEIEKIKQSDSYDKNLLNPNLITLQWLEWLVREDRTPIEYGQDYVILIEELNKLRQKLDWIENTIQDTKTYKLSCEATLKAIEKIITDR